MLQNLEILNGEMTPKFDKYNDIYSVSVANDVTFLELNYEVSDEYIVEVIGNQDFIEGDNNVYLEVIGENEITTYTLFVNKEKGETVSTLDFEYTPVDVVKEMPDYVAPLISIVCFVIILCTFALLFSKKKKVK